MIMVKWSDQSEKLIYRTYPEIHTFHVSLLLLNIHTFCSKGYKENTTFSFTLRTQNISF